MDNLTVQSLLYWTIDASYWGASVSYALLNEWSIETVVLYATIAARSGNQALDILEKNGVSLNG